MPLAKWLQFAILRQAPFGENQNMVAPIHGLPCKRKAAAKTASPWKRKDVESQKRQVVETDQASTSNETLLQIRIPPAAKAFPIHGNRHAVSKSSGQSCQNDSWIRMSYMVRNEQSGFLQTFQVFETRHFDAAQQPRQRQDETLEESRTNPTSSPSRAASVGRDMVVRCELERKALGPEVSLLRRFHGLAFPASARSRFSDFCLPCCTH